MFLGVEWFWTVWSSLVSDIMNHINLRQRTSRFVAGQERENKSTKIKPKELKSGFKSLRVIFWTFDALTL